MTHRRAQTVSIAGGSILSRGETSEMLARLVTWLKAARLGVVPRSGVGGPGNQGRDCGGGQALMFRALVCVVAGDAGVVGVGMIRGEG